MVANSVECYVDVSVVRGLIASLVAAPDVADETVSDALAECAADPMWLPPEMLRIDDQVTNVWLLARNRSGSFSAVAAVWGVAAVTPIHDHRVVTLSTLLIGALLEVQYQIPEGSRSSRTPIEVARSVEPAGSVTMLYPPNDKHAVSNLADVPSVAIQVYAGDLASIHRYTFDSITGSAAPLRSTYCNAGPLTNRAS